MSEWRQRTWLEETGKWIEATLAAIMWCWLMLIWLVKDRKAVPIFRWYDFYVGWYWSKETKCLYLFYCPMLGLKISFKEAR